jgi:hypothetical protein
MKLKWATPPLKAPWGEVTYPPYFEECPLRKTNPPSSHTKVHPSGGIRLKTFARVGGANRSCISITKWVELQLGGREREGFGRVLSNKAELSLSLWKWADSGGAWYWGLNLDGAVKQIKRDTRRGGIPTKPGWTLALQSWCKFAGVKAHLRNMSFRTSVLSILNSTVL